MPLSKQKLHASIVARTTFTYAGESVTVDYYPLRVLAATQAQFQAVQDEMTALADGDDYAGYAACVGRLWREYVCGWDVSEVEDGPPIALDDDEALLALDPAFDLLAAILAACREAQQHVKTGGTTSPRRSGGSTAPATPIPGSTPSGVSSRQTSRSRTSRSTATSRPGS